MKNIKKFLVVAFAFLVTLTVVGCGKKVEKSNLTPAEAFEKNESATKEVSNYKMDMNFTVGMKYAGQVYDITITEVGTFDAKNKTAYMEMNSNLLEGLGIDTTIKTYTKYDDTTATVYTESLGSWSKSVQNIAANPNTASSMGELAKADNVKEIEADKDNYNYEVTITKEDMNKVLAGMADDTTSGVIDSINKDVKVIISLDKETYRISKIKMDLTEVLKDANVQGVEYTKVLCEFKFYDYDKAGDVVIPDAALNAGAEEDNELED